jgi:hypothetical protein
VEPRCRFSASAPNNFLENDGSVLPPATSILPPVGLNKNFLVAFAESNILAAMLILHDNFLLLVNPGGFF